MKGMGALIFCCICACSTQVSLHNNYHNEKFFDPDWCLAPKGTVHNTIIPVQFNQMFAPSSPKVNYGGIGHAHPHAPPCKALT